MSSKEAFETNKRVNKMKMIKLVTDVRGWRLSLMMTGVTREKRARWRDL